MERESNSMQALCRSGCGFYGNPSTDGLCSLCYKEALKKKQQPPGATPAPPAFSSGPATSLMDTGVPTIPVIAQQPQDIKDHGPVKKHVKPGYKPRLMSEDKNTKQNGPNQCEGEAVGGSSGAVGSTESPDSKEGDKQDDKDKQKKKNRCAVCRKKVGLTGFECRCGGLYCAVHRYSDKHDCTFNYRELGAQEIRRNNPVVVGEKIHKI